MHGTVVQTILPLPGAPGAGVKIIQRAIARAHPDTAFLVRSDAGGGVRRPAGFRADHIPFAVVAAGQNAALRGNPNPALGVLANRGDGFKRQPGFAPNQLHRAGADEIQAAAARAGPEVALAILIQAINGLVGGGNRFQLAVFEPEKAVRHRANPQRSGAILEHNLRFGIRGQDRQLHRFKVSVVFQQPRAVAKPHARRSRATQPDGGFLAKQIGSQFAAAKYADLTAFGKP